MREVKRVGKKKKKKASKAESTPKKPITLSIMLDGKTILRQIQEFARESQKQTGRLTDDWCV